MLLCTPSVTGSDLSCSLIVLKLSWSQFPPRFFDLVKIFLKLSRPSQPWTPPLPKKHQMKTTMLICLTQTSYTRNDKFDILSRHFKKKEQFEDATNIEKSARCGTLHMLDGVAFFHHVSLWAVLLLPPPAFGWWRLLPASFRWCLRLRLHRTRLPLLHRTYLHSSV